MIRRFSAAWVSLAVVLAFFAVGIGPAQSASAGSPDIDGARAFANDWCVQTPYYEDRIADYMWITSLDNNNTYKVTEGASQLIDIKINMVATYCKYWPTNTDNGAKDLQVRYGGPYGVNKLVDGPAAVGYERKSTPSGVRQERGPYVSAGKLDVTGWPAGWNYICTAFQSTSSRPGAIFSTSPSSCFSIYLERINPWETSGWSRIGVNSQPNVTNWPANPPGSEKPTQPGDRLYWRHGVYNTGPGSADSISFAIGKSGFTNGWTGNIDPQGAFPLGADQTWEVGYQRSWPEYSVYDVQQNDVGNTLCESISWWPWKYDDGAGRNSSQWTGVPGGACTTVPYNFTLTPTVDVNVEAAESGTPIQVTSSISNSGPTKSLDDTEWRLFKFVLAPGASIPSAGESGSACPPVWTGCGAPQAQGSGIFGVSPATTNLPTVDYTVEDLELGSQVCYGLSVNKFAGSRGSNKGANNWWNGAPDCMVVGKKPKVQIWGGDAAVRGTIQTSTTTKEGKVFGSWVEYGALSVGANSLFASGSGLVDTDSGNQSTWSDLTFANTDTGRTPPFGYYAETADNFRPLPNISAYFDTLQNKQPYDEGQSLDANSFATGGAITVRTGGTIELDGQSLSKGRSVVIIATQKVTIKGSITYQGNGLAAVQDIPQLVIIAPAIDIQAGVTNVDAWLIAGNTVNTCSDESIDPGDGQVGLAGDVCDETLTVNGPVVADKLLLYRTAGSGVGAESGAPAEIFNLRPDTYLWAQLVASSGGKAQTVYSVELPPRF